MPEFKNFRFVSPGVQIKEIDNSARPRKADTIGPVVIGRAKKGLANQPVKVQSYADFVDQFGETVAGHAGGDIYRNGNDGQSPMYGTYAAKAFLRSNIAPLTYIRVLGQQHATPTGNPGNAGWQTDNGPGSNGGAIALWVFPSGGAGAAGSPVAFTASAAGQLAAVWYLDNGSIKLSGSLYNTSSTTTVVKSAGTLINSNAQGEFTIEIVGTNTSRTDVVTFGFNDANENFIRKKFNTNPQLRAAGDFYDSDAERDYWLGETFEQELRDSGRTSGNLVGLITGIALSGSTSTGPQGMLGAQTREARTGWFIGQDLGSAASYNPLNNTKLFRLIGRGHGEWLHRNIKVSIERIRRSTNTTYPYGSFSVVLRQINDTDNSTSILERFDGCNLDKMSPNYVAKKIGAAYMQWNSTDASLQEQEGEHPNRSKYVRVDMAPGIGGHDATLIPFGYYGPPKMSDVLAVTGSTTGRSAAESNKYVLLNGSSVPGWFDEVACTTPISSAAGGPVRHGAALLALTCSFKFPSVRLRNSASDGSMSDQTRAYFGMQTTRASGSTRADASVADPHRMWHASWPSDNTAGTGTDAFSYIFSMDDIVNTRIGATGSNYIYISGSRSGSTSYSSTGSNTYQTLLDAGYDSFTAPLWGGFDGFNIRVPDPMYNQGMTDVGTAGEQNSSIYFTWKRAIDSVRDPEFIDMNLLSAPGLTNTSLTTHMLSLCEFRADAMALIDLPDVYIPDHEQYKSAASARLGTTPTNAANDLRSRGIDNSYGATFYPWVQTVDQVTGQNIWIPPTVAMMGVLASSEKKSKLWFAPAGFNRGGLSDGAAGIPVINVTERLTSKSRDTLYDSNINPIASFPSSGIVVFGQKTLQTSPTALDRINVRRLVIYLKKQISMIANKILFDNNVQSTWNRFKGAAEPLLANVMSQFGITNYSLILDDTTTTADLIDQNILYAKIAIQPARAIEFIAIDFVITNSGASFED